MITLKELEDLDRRLDKDVAEFTHDVAHLRATRNPAAFTATNVLSDLNARRRLIKGILADRSITTIS